MSHISGKSCVVGLHTNSKSMAILQDVDAIVKRLWTRFDAIEQELDKFPTSSPPEALVCEASQIIVHVVRLTVYRLQVVPGESDDGAF